MAKSISRPVRFMSGRMGQAAPVRRKDRLDLFYHLGDHSFACYVTLLDIAPIFRDFTISRPGQLLAIWHIASLSGANPRMAVLGLFYCR